MLLPRTATDLAGGRFPGELVAYCGLACAVTGAAVLLTYLNLSDLQLWWKARNWTVAQCTVIQNDPSLIYRFVAADGRRFDASRVGIQDPRPELVEALTRVGSTLPCYYDPASPGETLLDREYDGWWWLPGAWALALFLLLQTAPALVVALWRWATFRPDPPLTWAQWFGTFYENGAWSFTVIGLAALVPGLAMMAFVTALPWWNWWQASSWQETRCEITKSQVRGWSGNKSGGYLLDIEYRYLWQGQAYLATTYSPWRLGGTEWLLQSTKNAGIEELRQRFAVGTSHRCYVSPEWPSRAYISRDRDNGATYITSIGPFLALLGLIVLCARR